jgi:hypothetical protein
MHEHEKQTKIKNRRKQTTNQNKKQSQNIKTNKREFN